MTTKPPVLEIASDILKRQGKDSTLTPDMTLRDVGFRSLDFAELALRIQKARGRPVELNAASLRRIETVGDMVSFFDEA